MEDHAAAVWVCSDQIHYGSGWNIFGFSSFFHIGSGPFGLPFIKMNLYTSGLGRFLTSALWIESKYSLGNYSVFHENVCLQGSLGRLYTFVHLLEVSL